MDPVDEFPDLTVSKPSWAYLALDYFALSLAERATAWPSRRSLACHSGNTI